MSGARRYRTARPRADCSALSERIRRCKGPAGATPIVRWNSLQRRSIAASVRSLVGSKSKRSSGDTDGRLSSTELHERSQTDNKCSWDFVIGRRRREPCTPRPEVQTGVTAHSRQILTWLTVATMVVGGWVGISVAQVASTTVPSTCTPARLVTRASMASRSGGATVRVVMTKQHYPSCTWSRSTGFQFVCAAGAPVGPVTLASTASSTRTILMTFQIVVNVVTMQGVHCTARNASRLRVITPFHRNVTVALVRPLGMCEVTITHWTTVSPAAFPIVPRCQGSSLRVGPGAGSAAVGTTYYPIRCTNTGAKTCSVSGTPSLQSLAGVSATNPRGVIGNPAKVIDQRSRGFGNAIQLAPSPPASAPSWVAESRNFPSSTCGARVARSLRIGLVGWFLVATDDVVGGHQDGQCQRGGPYSGRFRRGAEYLIKSWSGRFVEGHQGSRGRHVTFPCSVVKQ